MDAFLLIGRQKFEISANDPVINGIRWVGRNMLRQGRVETWLQRWLFHFLIGKGERMQGKNYHDHFTYFFWLCPQHVEIHRPEIKLMPQQWPGTLQ